MQWHQSLNTDRTQLKRYIKAAQLCVDDSEQRLAIDNIIHLLEGKETVIKIDCPAFRNSLNNPRSSLEQVYMSNELMLDYDQIQDKYKKWYFKFLISLCKIPIGSVNYTTMQVSSKSLVVTCDRQWNVN